MTDIQIKYRGLEETKRHNLVTEGQESSRIAETMRHNLVSEGETNRHNLATEQENVRHNKVGEDIAMKNYYETQRHNLVGESIEKELNETKKLQHLAGAREANAKAEQQEMINKLNKQSPDLFKINQYANILKGNKSDPLTILGFSALAGDAMVNGVPTIQKINEWIAKEFEKNPQKQYVNKPTTAREIRQNIGKFLDFLGK